MARPRRPSSSPERLLFLSFLLVAAAGSAVLLVAAKAAASALIKNNSSGENNSESNATAARRRGPLGAALFGGAGSLWDADLFHLPPEGEKVEEEKAGSVLHLLLARSEKARRALVRVARRS
jgi:hypothetical protein